jgi:hypothetical protein
MIRPEAKEESTMMKPATLAAASLVAILGLSNGAVARDWVDAPQAGTYQALVYVQSATGGCLDKAGFAFVGSMSYSGFGGVTHYLRALQTGSNYAVVSVQTLTVKVGKGTTHPSGNLAWTGGGVGNSWNVGGTFSASVTEIGTHAFVLQLKESYNGCSEEDINVSLARIGANQ